MVTLMFSCDKKEDGRIDVSWQLIENQYQGKSQLKSEITFTNNSRFTLNNDNWEFYFNWFRSIKDEQECEKIEGKTINGDYSYIKPTEKFGELKPGESFTFPLLGSHYAINKSDAISGCYFLIKAKKNKEILLSSGETNVLAFPANEQLRKASYDKLKVQTAEMRYRENEDLYHIPNENLVPIFPTPRKVTPLNNIFELKPQMDLFYHKSLKNEANYLLGRLNARFESNIMGYKYKKIGFRKYDENRITLELVEGPPESYKLRIDPNVGIVIQGADAAGVFYGVQSLLSVLPADLNNVKDNLVAIPQLVIEDAPRFPYRGMHLDVSRSFHGQKEVMRFIELISSYKLNKLHFHITDDEGWRVEIKDLPELTEIGAFRGHTKDDKDHLQPTLGSGPFADPENGNGSGFYTREEFIQILRFARQRHVEVIPEIDMPGHMRSALKAMEVRYDRYMAEGKKDSAEMYLLTDFEDTTFYTSAQRYHDNTANPCMESTFNFVQVVINELVDMYKEAKAPLSTLHIGGDEVPRGAFTYSPICQKFLAESTEYDSPSELHKYFTKRVTKMLNEFDIHTAGWEEVACKHENKKRVPDPTLVEEGIHAYIWNNVWGWGAEDLGYKLANEGFPVVLLSANNFYFDFAYNRDPEEPGLYWGGYTDTRTAWEFTPMDVTKCAETTLYGVPVDESAFEGKVKLTEKGKKNILGMSGTLWSETMRTWDRMEYMAFPKILALAERTWSKQASWVKIEDKDERIKAREIDWNRFANKIGQDELPKLDQYHVNYRIPLPGAIIEDGYFKANIRFPGLFLRYTLDGSDPTAKSNLYNKAIKVAKGETVKIAAFNYLGRSSRVVKVSN